MRTQTFPWGKSKERRKDHGRHGNRDHPDHHLFHQIR